MIKKLILAFLFIFFIAPYASAKDIPVKIKTLSKISTSNVTLQEGDNIKFSVIDDVYIGSKLYLKTGAPVTGVITSLVDNGFTCQEASIYAENFRVKNVDGDLINLKGIVYKKGRNHWMLAQFLPVIYIFIRGGEAHILPDKDIFILYLEANDEAK